MTCAGPQHTHATLKAHKSDGVGSWEAGSATGQEVSVEEEGAVDMITVHHVHVWKCSKLNLKFKNFSCIFYAHGCFAYMHYLHITSVEDLRRPEEGVGFPKSRVVIHHVNTGTQTLGTAASTLNYRTISPAPQTKPHRLFPLGDG